MSRTPNKSRINNLFSKNSRNKKSSNTNYLYFVLGTTFFLYVLIRAIYVGATIDEITTIQGVTDLSYLDILSNAFPTANNHIVNTILIKALFSFKVNFLLIARFPNIISFIPYAYFGYKLGARYLSPIVGIGCFILLMCNPFLLDFFSLARGYGLSLAFMMGALYFGTEFFSSGSSSSLVKSLLFSSLSVFSIFSMIYFWMGLVSALTLTSLLRKNFSFFKTSLIYSLLTGIVLSAVILPPILRLIEVDALTYGGKNGFYPDTLVSLTRYSLYSFDLTRSVYLSLNFSLGLFFLTALLSYYRSANHNSPKSLFLGTTVLSVILIVLAHHLVGVRYPLSRVALFLYPLFILSICFCLNDIIRNLKIPILALLPIPFVFNFISNANFYKTSIWSFDSHTEEILDQINERGRSESRIVSFACTPVIYPSVNYYIKQNNYPFLRIIQDEAQLVPAGVDYYLLSERDTASLSEEDYIKRWVCPLDSYDKDIFLEYPEDHLVVFEHLRAH